MNQQEDAMRRDAQQLAWALGIVLSKSQVVVCEYLESRGLRFCVHFGTDNCVQMAADLYVKHLAQKPKGKG